MHDHFNELYEWDEHGNKRRKRVLRDLEQISFPMTMAFKDAAGFHTHFSDGSPDHTSPHQPGYRLRSTSTTPQRLPPTKPMKNVRAEWRMPGA